MTPLHPPPLHHSLIQSLAGLLHEWGQAAVLAGFYNPPGERVGLDVERETATNWQEASGIESRLLLVVPHIYVVIPHPPHFSRFSSTQIPQARIIIIKTSLLGRNNCYAANRATTLQILMKNN